jgi:hypothetical protein
MSHKLMELEQPTQKRARISPKVWTIIAIVVILLATIAVFISGPDEEEHDSLFGNNNQPTVIVKNPLASQDINQRITYNGVQMTFTSVAQAGSFSDDRHSTYFKGYTVRVMVQVGNPTSQIVGTNYSSLVRLRLPSGSLVKPELISINAESLPHKTQNGYFDFAISQKVDLSALVLQIGTVQVSLRP